MSERISSREKEMEVTGEALFVNRVIASHHCKREVYSIHLKRSV